MTCTDNCKPGAHLLESIDGWPGWYIYHGTRTLCDYVVHRYSKRYWRIGWVDYTGATRSTDGKNYSSKRAAVRELERLEEEHRDELS
jgi:erythromycin esterase-like protein